MNTAMTWAEELTLLIPIIVAVLVWLLNEYSKRRWEQYKRREDRYFALIESIRGFYLGPEQMGDKDKKEEFLKQLDLCWLYCPDTVIQRAYNFLDHVSTGVKKPEDEKEVALGAFVLEVRKDLRNNKPFLWRRTKLTARDFRLLSST